MTPESSVVRTEVLLSFQRALWDLVTPALRAVAVRVRHALIEARFVYESLGADERELAAEAEAYVAADFVPPVEVRFDAVEISTSLKRDLAEDEEWVYLRREAQRRVATHPLLALVMGLGPYRVSSRRPSRPPSPRRRGGR